MLGEKTITYQGADDQHRPSLVVVLPARDDVPLLTSAAVARFDLDRGQVGAEVSRQFIDEEALSIGRLRCQSVVVHVR